MRDLFPHQLKAVELLKSGSILRGGVGSGKTTTALYYFKTKRTEQHLYVITTAKKRDSHDWEDEALELDIDPSRITVDSWNNISNYRKARGFFIFDEQRVTGSGSWVASFLYITRFNQWILLSATPGDQWIELLPVFMANGYYKNRKDFIDQHVVYNPYVKFPMIQRYINVGKLIAIRNEIMVDMECLRHTTRRIRYIQCRYNADAEYYALTMRQNPDTNEPFLNVSELCAYLRRLTNNVDERVHLMMDIQREHPKLIVFYNFDYELEKIKMACDIDRIPYAQWNGHKHEPIPSTDRWIYIVQYLSGAEGWNCIETDTILFYSMSYSYKQTEQAMGRIDRINTPFTELNYIFLTSNSKVDRAIYKALCEKRDFNQKGFGKQYGY